MKKLLLTAALIATATTAFARDQIQIAGSSTVLPYSIIVAEQFSENFDFPTPVVEGGGSGAGRKKLCEGVGEHTIDIANSSSKMPDSEFIECAENGVTEILEVRFGFDGIVFASDINQPQMSLTSRDIYLASTGSANSWNEIRAELPDREIELLVPGTKHGTREVFEKKVLEAGCDLDDKEACTKLRADGRVVEIDGDYTETLARIGASPAALGVFGLSFYQNNTATLQVSDIDGVTPSVETISSGDYPVSRPLYFYVKLQHIYTVPGLADYIKFMVSDDMSGPDGALTAYGLVPDPALAETQQIIDGRF